MGAHVVVFSNLCSIIPVSALEYSQVKLNVDFLGEWREVMIKPHSWRKNQIHWPFLTLKKRFGLISVWSKCCSKEGERTALLPERRSPGCVRTRFCHTQQFAEPDLILLVCQMDLSFCFLNQKSPGVSEQLSTGGAPNTESLLVLLVEDGLYGFLWNSG